MSWQKGQSGNPGGRSKRDRLVREAWQRAINADGSDKAPLDEYVELCRGIMKDQDAKDRDRLLAGNSLMAHGYGSPTTHVSIGEGEPQPETDLGAIVDVLDDEGLKAYELVLGQIERAKERARALADAKPPVLLT